MNILGYVLSIVVVVGSVVFLKNGNRISQLFGIVDDKIAGIIGSKEKWESYKSFAVEAIAAVEMTSKNEEMTSEEKKQLAISLAQDFMGVAGLPLISEELIGYIIEAEGLITGLFGNKEKKS